MYPGAGLWNLLASFDAAHRWHLRAIPMDPTGVSSQAEHEDLGRPAAAA